MNIAIGWRFYSADFSINAVDTQGMKHGAVILIRDPIQRAAWHDLSETEQMDIPLYVSGRGVDLHTALQDANSSAMCQKVLA
jgi:hypothetical protein